MGRLKDRILNGKKTKEEKGGIIIREALGGHIPTKLLAAAAASRPDSFVHLRRTGRK
jgi:hypothetical protein